MHPVDASAAGLAEFVNRACLARGDRNWVRDEARRLRNNCGWSDNGDCAARVDGSATWQAPTSNGSALIVTASWDRDGGPYGPPRRGPLYCTIELPDGFGREMPELTNRLRLTGNMVFGPTERATARLYDAVPRIDVLHSAGADLPWVIAYSPAR
jgi:hypothetical protein